MGLHARGAQVCVVPVYRTIEFSSVDDSLVEILKTKIFDRAIFTSPSSVRSTKKALGSHHAILRKVRTFAIGDATRIELEKHGHEDVETAHTHSGKGIIEKLTEDL
jgi:uroporphyrinogen-III synthase